ncbi:MAG: metallophosphoesterase [Candidatus Adiutrix sp.]|jgi:predicted MPP superfamily phosphohydrolase|nr:metallophosphoesterase [Candidatus Adiutrix sp.]
MLSQQFNTLLFTYKAPLFVLLCLAGQILAWRFWLRRAAKPFHRLICHLVFIVFNLAWLFAFSALYFSGAAVDLTWTFFGRPAVAWQLAYILVILPLGTLASLLTAVIRLPLRLGKKPPVDFNFKKERRNLLKSAGGAAVAVILGGCGYGVIRQGSSPAVNRQTIVFPGLPRALDGFVIAQLSDLHLGLWSSQREIDRAAAVAAAAGPHLVVVTGDIIDRNPEFARLCFDPLKRFADVPYGVWGILGNHDHYTGPQRIASLLQSSGLINMLMDRQVRLPELPMSIIGLDDQGAHHFWMGTGALTGRKDDPDVLDFKKVKGPPPEPDDFVLLLNHRPEGLRQAGAHGCRLYLAGHTHGGQYQVPFRDQLNLASMFYKYSSGLYHENGCWLNVSRGLASVGVPFRLWAWPEVNLITLKRA